MSCQQLVELVTEYLENELDPETRRRFDEHLELCPGCVVYVEQMRETSRRLGSVPVDSVSPEAEHVLLTAFRDFHRRPGDD
ncbi:anti-sigma factor family protein [Aeromicrobium sp. CF4.19]|uniref:anti-sigma factor family protein n=1 Tax=Aeromicrobium sp. CF4.19 TaxID=3373082 RepID=UPI003EE4F6E4